MRPTPDRGRERGCFDNLLFCPDTAGGRLLTGVSPPVLYARSFPRRAEAEEVAPCKSDLKIEQEIATTSRNVSYKKDLERDMYAIPIRMVLTNLNPTLSVSSQSL